MMMGWWSESVVYIPNEWGSIGWLGYEEASDYWDMSTTGDALWHTSCEQPKKQWSTKWHCHRHFYGSSPFDHLQRCLYPTTYIGLVEGWHSMVTHELLMARSITSYSSCKSYPCRSVCTSSMGTSKLYIWPHSNLTIKVTVTTLIKPRPLCIETSPSKHNLCSAHFDLAIYIASAFLYEEPLSFTWTWL